MDITQFIYSRRDTALQLGDYAFYRAQLSRQLASTRKRLGRSTPKNAKYSTKAPITAEDIGGNPEFAHLILLVCERARAHAMLIKATHAEDTKGKGISGQARSHIISKLHKAAELAQQLADLLAERAASKATDVDILEAEAYAKSLAGTKEFEKHASGRRSGDVQAQKQKWEACLRNFSCARIIYTALLQSRKKEVYKEVIAGEIDPSMRYAAYQSHIPRTVPVVLVARQNFPKDIPNLVDAVKAVDETVFEDQSAKAGTDSAIPNTITWRKRKANIVDASIGQALATVSNAEDQLKSSISSIGEDAPATEKAAAYDVVLTAIQDAVDATRHAIEDHEKEGISESDARMQDLRVTNLAVNYSLIGWRVGRNRVLIGDDDGAELGESTHKKPKQPRKNGKESSDKRDGNGRKLARLRERVVLYDSILQSIDSIKELPGATELSFREELDSKRAYFQALKCLNIAYSHDLLSHSREALALLIRAEALSSSTLSKANLQPTSSPSELKQLDISPSLIQSLQARIQNLVNHHRGLVELHNLSENSRIAAEKHMTSAAPIVERLNDYPANGVDLKNLVTYPPQLKPVPVKPLFFDVAWNYIDYPGRTPELANGETGKTRTEVESQEEKKKGWFGWRSR